LYTVKWQDYHIGTARKCQWIYRRH